jgi:hypothetical protein
LILSSCLRLVWSEAGFDPLRSLAALPITSIQVKVDCTDNIAFWQAARNNCRRAAQLEANR